MALMSYWKGSSSKTQKPSRDDAFPAINTPRTPEDGAWTLMDTETDGLSPPTYPDFGPQPGPTRASARPSTNGATGYRHPTVFHLCLSRRGNDAHMHSVGSGCPRSSHRVSFPSPPSVRFPQYLRLISSTDPLASRYATICQST